MQYFYELVKNQQGLPIKAFIHSINGLEMHWHNEIEIILVLRGSVNIRVGNDHFHVRENDLLLINSNEVHNTCKTREDNVLLAIQINPDYYAAYYPEFRQMVFDCKSFLFGKDAQERFDVLRHYLAKIVWELNKKRSGHRFIIGSEMNLLAAHLINSFDYMLVKDEESNSAKDIERLQSIISYIDENLDSKVSLKEIAKELDLSIYYLSRFFKEKMGITFQEYLNNIRLDKAINLLSNTNTRITEISYTSGFSNTKSFNKLFKDMMGCTPSEYRREYGNIGFHVKGKHATANENISRTYLDVDRTSALKKLFSYLKPLDQDDMFQNAKSNIPINAQRDGTNFKHYWKQLITFSRASEGLRKSWQIQLKELQRDIGFRYIRFHGIFCDDMMVCNIGDGGNIVYNWSYVDELFDFFMEVEIKPFIELGFMPSELKKSDEMVFWWKANISGPRDIGLWTDLVVEFLKHCIDRYGLQEVETWYFEVWNEPDLEYVFWVGGKDEYLEFYEETSLAIKSVSKSLRVGGPSITHQTISDSTWLEDFMDYCVKHEVPLDFISLHIYPESYSSKKKARDLALRAKRGEDLQKLMTEWQSTKRVYFGKNHTLDTVSSANCKINNLMATKPELHITEWNSSSYGRNLIHDTCFVAVFIIANILKCIGKVDSIGYWTFTDIMEETKAGISAFHGGFGLINKDGLKKPSYYAYYLLSRLGDKILEQGEGYIVTKEGKDIQVLAYNYAYFDDLFLNGDTSALANNERYLVYEAKPPKEIQLHISGLFGDYKITRYWLNRENGSVYDEWVKMGSPENMTREELDYLRGKAYPKVTVKNLKLDGNYKEKLYVPVHGIELVILDKKL